MNSKETPEQIEARVRAKMALASAKKAAESRQASNNGNNNLNQISEETVVAPHVPAPVTNANPSNEDEQTPKKSFCCCF
ncbi:hypothetical protein IHE45_07G014400 [Dioscorea alata]|uniref:Uncharacterized protein n=1 Tax=Dioscorea alata TaxID=55571 RepID=A0ACB7VP92_DIOAL|nr:hypothetical protein IHE45_07G014400 [Dioscorea alata]